MKVMCIKIEMWGKYWKYTFRCVEQDAVPRFLDNVVVIGEKPDQYACNQTYELDLPK